MAKRKKKTNRGHLYIIFISLVAIIVVGLYSNKKNSFDQKSSVLDTSSTISLDLASALVQENIKADLSKYNYSNDKINIYLFRGHGCTYSNNFLEYIVSIIPKYGKYFNLITYEVWYNSYNEKLEQNIANKLEVTANGVPFIVIGKQSFMGYSSSRNELIEKAIISLYSSKDRYDVLK